MFLTFLRKFALPAIFLLGLAPLPACQFTSPPTELTGDEAHPSTSTASVDELDFLDQTLSLLPDYRGDVANLPDLPHYRIRAEIDLESISLNGHMILDYTNLESVNLDRLYLRLYPNGGASYGNGEITVTHLQLDGQAVDPTLSLNDSVLEVPFTNDLPPGGKAELSLDFYDQIPVDFGGEETPYAYGIFNYSEGVLALSGWYPILAVYDQDGWNLDPVRPVGDAVYSDTAFYSVEVILPKDNILAATGLELNREVRGNESVVQIASGPARDFFLVASPDFKLASEQIDDVLVNVYTMGELPDTQKVMLNSAVDSVKIFDHDFGVYPFRELDVVQAPMKNAGGVEFPGIVLIEAGRSLDPQDPILATTVAHEVAHQWWYGLVGNDVIDEPWVDEALATYSSMLYWDEAYGHEAYKQILADFQSRYARALENEVPGEINYGIDYYSQADTASGYGSIVYIKGALFFAALREEIGDQAFFNALQSYYLENRYGIAAGEDLLLAFETASGRSLEGFYQEWMKIGE